MKISARIILFLLTITLTLGSQFSIASDIENFSAVIEEASEIRLQPADSSDDLDDVLICLGTQTNFQQYPHSLSALKYCVLFPFALVPDARAPPFFS